jgi:hypothetical protein
MIENLREFHYLSQTYEGWGKNLPTSATSRIALQILTIGSVGATVLNLYAKNQTVIDAFVAKVVKMISDVVFALLDKITYSSSTKIKLAEQDDSDSIFPPLPNEIFLSMCSFLDVGDIVRLQRINKRAHEVLFKQEAYQNFLENRAITKTLQNKTWEIKELCSEGGRFLKIIGDRLCWGSMSTIFIKDLRTGIVEAVDNAPEGLVYWHDKSNKMLCISSSNDQVHCLVLETKQWQVPLQSSRLQTGDTYVEVDGKGYTLSTNNTIFVKNLEPEKSLGVLETHGDVDECALNKCYASDHEKLYSSDKFQVLVQDLKTNAELPSLQLPHLPGVITALMITDKKLFVKAVKGIYYFDLKTNQLLATYKDINLFVRMRASNGRLYIESGRHISIWNLETREFCATIKTAYIKSFEVRAGKLYVELQDGKIQVIDLVPETTQLGTYVRSFFRSNVRTGVN